MNFGDQVGFAHRSFNKGGLAKTPRALIKLHILQGSMKKILLLLSILVIRGSVCAQEIDQSDFNGNWLVQLGGEKNISLHFSDSDSIYFSLGSNNEWNGHYIYKIGKSNVTFVLTLRSTNSGRKDTFGIFLIKNSDEEYKITEIMHFHEDGRPPENELLDNTVYILKKVKNN